MLNPEKDYAKLKNKNKNLPEWKWIENNFRPEFEEGNFLEQLREEITGKIGETKNMIEPLIAGSENYCCWFERKFLSAKDKEDLFNIYKDLLSLIWFSNKINVNFSEKNHAEWLSEVRKIWEKWKDRISSIFDKISVNWKDYKKPVEETTYHG